MIYVFGKCSECGDEIDKRLYSKKSGLCLIHYSRSKPKKKNEIKPVSDKQSLINKEDQKFYLKIWKKRKHVSELSGKPLGDKLKSIFFSHILAKKPYPAFRHREDNIILLTPQEHYDWEFTDRKDPKFDIIKERYEALKIEYNQSLNHE